MKKILVISMVLLSCTPVFSQSKKALVSENEALKKELAAMQAKPRESRKLRKPQEHPTFPQNCPTV